MHGRYQSSTYMCFTQYDMSLYTWIPALTNTYHITTMHTQDYKLSVNAFQLTTASTSIVMSTTPATSTQEHAVRSQPAYVTYTCIWWQIRHNFNAMFRTTLSFICYS